MPEEKKRTVKVSVMITTYNLEKYIAKTLDSVLGQKTQFAYEILIGDDGSRDQTVTIIEKYRIENPDIIRIYHMPREEGTSCNKVERAAANRMFLWERAAGEYACFLDGDDYYSSMERLQKMCDILDREENRDCIMCAHNLSMHYENGNDFPLCRAEKERKISFPQYWPLMFLQANALLFRNEPSLRQLPEPLRGNFDDNNITYWLFQKGKMYYLPECLGAYRQLEDSSWNSNDELKKACSNLLGLQLELLTAPQNERYSLARHFRDLDYLYRHKEQLRPENCSPFYETARKYHLDGALCIYEAALDTGGHEAEKTLKRNRQRAEIYYRQARILRGLRKLAGRY